jgi:mono/diheme cytochrome c family protein
MVDQRLLAHPLVGLPQIDAGFFGRSFASLSAARAGISLAVNDADAPEPTPHKEPHAMTTLVRRPCSGAATAGRRLAALAFVLSAALSNANAMPANVVHGEQLAKRWCATCHIVSPEQTHGADNVPAFATIARIPDFSADKIANFLMDPHPKMPDMQLGRDEAKDLGAYIASLAQ